MFLRYVTIALTALVCTGFFHAPSADIRRSTPHYRIFPSHVHIDDRPIQQAGVVEETPGDASCESTIFVKVYDQRCADCAEHLIKNLSAYAGFQRAGFDPYRSNITLTMLPGSTIDDERIRRLMFDSGYVPYNVLRGCDNARFY